MCPPSSIELPNFNTSLPIAITGPSFGALVVLRSLPRRHRPFAELDDVVDGNAYDSEHDEYGKHELDVHRAGATQQHVTKAFVRSDKFGDDGGSRGDRGGRL